jgi:DTW domain-containing protein YfiP
MSEQANPKSGVLKSGISKSGPAEEVVPDCPHCGKPLPLCICDSVTPIKSKVSLLILQHPQEQDRALGSARLAALHFRNATFKIGLSWPSLSKIVGRETDPKAWAILYLGSLKAKAFGGGRDIVVTTGKGAALGDQGAALRGIEGIILLDGTWSQAKAMWWRNAWMLKCRRVLLARTRPSRYGKLRKEPRGDGLATIEAAAMLMARLEKNPKIEAALNTSFAKMLERYRAAHGKGTQG